ncbi:hypothetical protein MMC22_006982 [Lobaria immixta]|nr:hypothetical protein [Lobaria immixta]
MQWGNEADLQLFKILLKTHEVKVDYKVLAEAMGNGITPKAITHRIGRIRTLPGPGDDGDTTPTSTPKAKGTPKKITPKKTPTPRGAAKAAKAAASDSSPTKAATRGKGKKRGAAALAENGDETEEQAETVNQDDDESSQGSATKKAKVEEKLGDSNADSEENVSNYEAEI